MVLRLRELDVTWKIQIQSQPGSIPRDPGPVPLSQTHLPHRVLVSRKRGDGTTLEEGGEVHPSCPAVFQLTARMPEKNRKGT